MRFCRFTWAVKCSRQKTGNIVLSRLVFSSIGDVTTALRRLPPPIPPPLLIVSELLDFKQKMYLSLCFFSELAEGKTKIAELEHMVTNLSRESQDKRELLESIQSDKETISK